MKVCVPFGNGKVVHAIYADLFSLPRISIWLFACNKHAQHSAAKMFANRSKKKNPKQAPFYQSTKKQTDSFSVPDTPHYKSKR